MNSSALKMTVWSPSRMATLNRCARQHYYRYLAPRDPSAPIGSRFRTLYHLRFLTTVPMLTGSLVHSRIREALLAVVSDHPISPHALISSAQLSFEATARWAARAPLHQICPSRPKLIRDEAGRPLTTEEFEAAKESIASQIRAFFLHPRIQELISPCHHILPDFADAIDFEISRDLGVPVCVKTDAVSIRGREYYIWDWKCGRPHASHREAARAYDLHLRRKLRLTASTPVTSRFVYLGDGTEQDFRFSTLERAEKLWQIGEEFGDLERESIRAPRGESAFPARVHASCRDCPFQFICPEFKAKLGGAK